MKLFIIYVDKTANLKHRQSVSSQNSGYGEDESLKSSQTTTPKISIKTGANVAKAAASFAKGKNSGLQRTKQLTPEMINLTKSIESGLGTCSILSFDLQILLRYLFKRQ